jgi:hypothetical protein
MIREPIKCPTCFYSCGVMPTYYAKDKVFKMILCKTCNGEGKMKNTYDNILENALEKLAHKLFEYNSPLNKP